MGGVVSSSSCGSVGLLLLSLEVLSSGVGGWDAGPLPTHICSSCCCL